MRSRFDEQLALLNKEMIEMGALCEKVISLAVDALKNGDSEAASKVSPFDSEIDEKERTIEALCLKLLLQQQPVARDLRQISAALKMITDMERIGDQAEDIAEIITFLGGRGDESDGLLENMAHSVIKMVTQSIDAYVKCDTILAMDVINQDDTVDAYFDEVKKKLISRIANDQLGALRKKTDEFEQITDNMKEGLVLLDNDGKILSINPAACRLFETTRDCIGSDFLSIDRSLEISSAIKLADESGHSETREKYGDRTYQFDVSRIESDGAARGSVILFFDMTEQQNSEKIRREFTANVSHELKTPLQGIIGSAELIENGMVRDEDMPRFVGHIRSEAQRLVSLINDIIRLSQLDEGDEMPRENVGLLSLSQEISEDLGAAAKKKNVTLNVGGREAYVFGVPRLLYEIVYNLCDNAIKYNREGGRVDISVENENSSAVLTVSDTGIGIAPKHQARIFERFYRVDKSHSKATGGTGLGLSIVKHAVLCHGGTLSLESEENKGTRITVTLPLSK